MILLVTCICMYFVTCCMLWLVAASGYVLMRGLEDPNRSRYKLMLNCIMISKLLIA